LQGVNVNAKNTNGDTPLHTAVPYSRQVEIVKCLISLGADVNAKNNSGATPLYDAARSTTSNVEVLKCLISLGADVNAADKYGKTPLDIAGTEEKKAIIRAAGGLGQPTLRGVLSSLNQDLQQSVQTLKRLDQQVQQDIDRFFPQAGVPLTTMPQASDAKKPVLPHPSSQIATACLCLALFITFCLVASLFFHIVDSNFARDSGFGMVLQYWLPILIVDILLIATGVTYGRASQSQCPHCKQFKAVNPVAFSELLGNPKLRREFKCKHCGYEWIYEYGKKA